MAGEHILQFGDYEFPLALNVTSLGGDSRIGAADIPRRAGQVAQLGQPAARAVSAEGTLFSDELRAALDTMAAALNAGEQPLWLYDDRYLLAQKQSFSHDWEPGNFQRYCTVAVSFLCADPYFYAADESTETWTTPGNGDDITITAAGNAPCRPVFSITAGATGSWALTLAVGDSAFSLTGDATSGDVIIVDCAAETVTLDSDGSDQMALFDGSFQSFSPGENLIGLSNVGVPVAQVAIRWRGRWY